jgi:hypothetical protein
VDFFHGDIYGGTRSRACRGNGKEGIAMMKAVAILLTAVGLAGAADAPTVAGLYDAQLKNAEGEVVSLAEAMPASKFDFKPAASLGEFAKVRTFAEQ